MTLFVSVGTAPGGFDRLVEGADRAARELGLGGLAQIGDGSYRPRALAWCRFLPAAEMHRHLSRRPLVICHGGMGILGEALRAGCRVLCVPRDRPTGKRHLSNDQRAFVEALATRLPVIVCPDPGRLAAVIARLPPPPPRPVEPPASDVPDIVASFLARDLAGRSRG